MIQFLECNLYISPVLVGIAEGEVPMISVLDRDWNDDGISSKLQISLSAGVSTQCLSSLYSMQCSRSHILGRPCV